MRIGNVAGLGVLAWCLAVSTAGADVRVTMKNGRVSLVAKDATLRQILDEWARVGQAKFVNVERIPGGPVLSIELSNMSEQQALDVLLRSVSGYLLAPRGVPSPNLSQFDRIIVMPTSVAPRVTAGAPAGGPPAAGVVFQPPQLAPGAEEDDRPSIAAPRGPVFGTYPQSGPPTDQQALPPGVFPPPPQPPMPAAFPGAPTGQAPAGAPGSTPGGTAAPMGTARPGEVLQPPQPRPQP
jgi:hypothetical protein